MPVTVAYSYFNACLQEGKITVLNCLAMIKVSPYVCHDVCLKGSLNALFRKVIWKEEKYQNLERLERAGDL